MFPKIEADRGRLRMMATWDEDDFGHMLEYADDHGPWTSGPRTTMASGYMGLGECGPPMMHASDNRGDRLLHSGDMAVAPTTVPLF
jgi:hypothetical protein